MSDITWVTTGNSMPSVRADLEAALAPQGAVPIDAEHHRAPLHVVKNGAHRTVYYLNLPEAGLYLKHYKTPNLRSRLKNLLRGSDARQEFRRAEQIRQRGIATITPLAFGERRVAGIVSDSFLATREIAEAVSLDIYLHNVFTKLDRSAQGRARRELARQLAELTATMHAQGITHNDFHPGNVLVETVGAQPKKLHLIDLQAARISRPLAWRRARSSLVVLNLSFFQRASRTDRLRFLRAYLAHRPELAGDLRSASREIERGTCGFAPRFWRRHARRCLRPCRDFYQVDAQGRTAFALRQVPKRLVARLVDDPSGPLAQTDSVVLKQSARTTVARVTVRVNGCQEHWVLKRVVRKNWWLGLWRDSVARRAWTAGHSLVRSRVPTPRPWVLIESRHPQFGREGYLFLPWIAGGLTLDRHLAEQIAPLAPAFRRRAIRELTEHLAALVRRLHESHFDHRDLKAINLVVTRDAARKDQAAGPNGPLEVFLLDLDCVKRRRNLTTRRRAQNLARLHVSFHAHPLITRTDKLRFLRRYLPWGLQGRHDWKALWRRVDCLTRRKIRQNQRRGRVIS